MGLLDKLFGGKKENKAPDAATPDTPKFLRKEQSGESTYEIYKGADAASAKRFLLTKRVQKPQYYVLVETPEGNWGMDVKGLYLERLLPWQTNLASAEVDGSICKLPDMDGVQFAAKGLNTNFVADLRCGKCEHEWVDGVRYRAVTVVRCPQCKTLNKVDSGHIQCIFVG
jgi:phage FluMu protein Com